MYVQQLQDFDVQTLKAWSVARPWRRMTTRHGHVYLTKLGAIAIQRTNYRHAWHPVVTCPFVGNDAIECGPL